MNIPNLLTWSRISLIPFFFFFFYLPFKWSRILAAGIFAFAALTDWLDGYLARSLDQTSALGAFLDPVADKLIVVCALVLIVGAWGPYYVTIPAAIIVCREIVISALREWMAEIGKNSKVNVTLVAKVKTGVQMAALIILLLYRPGSWPVFGVTGLILLYVAAALTLWSMFIYLRAAWPEFSSVKGSNPESR